MQEYPNIIEEKDMEKYYEKKYGSALEQLRHDLRMTRVAADQCVTQAGVIKTPFRYRFQLLKSRERALRDVVRLYESEEQTLF